LGTACYGLTKALSSVGTDIMFVLPRPVATPFSTHVRLLSPKPGSPLASPTTEFRLDEFEHVTFRTIDAQMSDPYRTPEQQARLKELLAARERAQHAAAVPAVMEDLVGSDPLSTTPGFIGSASPGAGMHYSGDLFAEIQRYAALAAEIARNESFDVVQRRSPGHSRSLDGI
jgi:glycogen synthase